MLHSMLKAARFAWVFALCAICSIVKVYAGGDQFEVHLNGKLVSKQFVINGYRALTVQLSESDRNGDLTILYSHCGEKGTNRVVFLKDEKGNIIRQWRFADNSSGLMHVPVK